MGENMTRKVLFFLLCIVTGSVASSANPASRAEMIKKYGPVPSAILEPSERSDITSFYSICWTVMEKLGRAKVHHQYRDKTCFACQRVLKGAIDLYNQEHASPGQQIGKIDHKDVVDADNSLYTQKYLKSVPLMADSKCRMHSYGDLATDGIIYCEYHGTDPMVAKELRALSGYTLASEIQLRRQILIVVGILLAVFLMLFSYFRARANRVQ